MSKALKKLIDINRLREFKNKLVGVGSAYVQTTAVDQTIAGTKTFSKPIAGSVTGSSGSCTGNAATATKATQDSAGQQIDTTYIKGLAVSGRTITYTKGDGSTGTITTQDTNTWTAFKGATSSANGTAGYVPAPTKGNQGKYFKADGTWATPPNTTYASMSASEATTGTATAARTISAKVLHDKINSNLSAYSKNGHTHDDRYYTENEVNNLLNGKANSSHTHPYIPISASCNKNWHWSGKGGQPSWLWGSEDGTNMYVYNPSDFRVNYAKSANSAVTAANGVDSSGNGWIRFINGIQICWAVIPCGPSGASTWTYGARFSSGPVVTVCDQGRNTKAVFLTRAGDIRTTSCLIVMVDANNGSYMTGEAQCIAIGRWK